MCSLRKNIDSSICVAFKDLTSIISTTPIVVIFAIARVILHPKPLINLRQYALISRMIQVRPHWWNECEVVKLMSTHLWDHLLPVSPQDCRTSPRNARQAGCERRQAKMINKNRLICYTACAISPWNAASIESQSCALVQSSRVHCFLNRLILLDSSDRFKIVLIIKFLKQIFLLYIVNIQYTECVYK